MENEKALMVIDTKIIEDYLFSTETKLNPQHKKLFMALAIHNQLDPFRREIYAVPYKDKEGTIRLSVVTGYEVYLKRAERSGKLSGWKIWAEGTGEQLRAIIEIYRKDWTQPLKHEVMFKEYNLGRSLWLTKPMTMIKKVAIAQGFRLAFPEEIGGMPYTADEIEIETNKKETVDVIPEIVELSETKSQEDIDKEMEELKKESEKKFVDLHDRMAKMVNKFELQNWWKKHQDDIKSLMAEHRTQLEKYKDKLKEKFNGQ